MIHLMLDPNRLKTAGLDLLRLAALPVLFVLGHEAFRLAYYGEWVPNTALVKFHPSGTHAADGRASFCPLKGARGGMASVLPDPCDRRRHSSLITTNLVAAQWMHL